MSSVYDAVQGLAPRRGDTISFAWSGFATFNRFPFGFTGNFLEDDPRSGLAFVLLLPGRSTLKDELSVIRYWPGIIGLLLYGSPLYSRLSLPSSPDTYTGRISAVVRYERPRALVFGPHFFV
jgi:hypothetical protein